MSRQRVKGLGGRLKSARDLEDMYQWEVAAKCGCQVTEISRYEKGSREPSLTNLVKLAAALGVTTDWLLKGGK